MSAPKTFACVVAALFALFGIAWVLAQAAIWGTERFGGWPTLAVIILLIAMGATWIIESGKTKP